MKETTIIIEGKPFTYYDEMDDISYDASVPISVEKAKELLQTTKQLFNSRGIHFSLVFGTLLGAVRDNDLIKGDEDVDVFTDNEKELRRNLPYFYDNGLKVCRIYEHYYYSFHTTNNSYIDVYIKDNFSFSIWSPWCYRLYKHAVPKWYLWKYDTVFFLGIECLVPHKPERLLKLWYGKDWRIPVRGHSFRYDIPSHYWWRKHCKGKYDLFCYIFKLLLTNPFSFFRKFCKRLNH